MKIVSKNVGFVIAKSPHKLYIELLVKHQLYAELARFKEQRKLDKSERMTTQQIYLRNKQLLEKE